MVKTVQTGYATRPILLASSSMPGASVRFNDIECRAYAIWLAENCLTLHSNQCKRIVNKISKIVLARGRDAKLDTVWIRRIKSPEYVVRDSTGRLTNYVPGVFELTIQITEVVPASDIIIGVPYRREVSIAQLQFFSKYKVENENAIGEKIIGWVENKGYLKKVSYPEIEVVPPTSAVKETKQEQINMMQTGSSLDYIPLPDNAMGYGDFVRWLLAHTEDVFKDRLVTEMSGYARKIFTVEGVKHPDLAELRTAQQSFGILSIRVYESHDVSVPPLAWKQFLIAGLAKPRTGGWKETIIGVPKMRLDFPICAPLRTFSCNEFLDWVKTQTFTGDPISKVSEMLTNATLEQRGGEIRIEPIYRLGADLSETVAEILPGYLEFSLSANVPHLRTTRFKLGTSLVHSDGVNREVFDGSLFIMTPVDRVDIDQISPSVEPARDTPVDSVVGGHTLVDMYLSQSGQRKLNNLSNLNDEQFKNWAIANFHQPRLSRWADLPEHYVAMFTCIQHVKKTILGDKEAPVVYFITRKSDTRLVVMMYRPNTDAAAWSDSFIHKFSVITKSFSVGDGRQEEIVAFETDEVEMSKVPEQTLPDPVFKIRELSVNGLTDFSQILTGWVDDDTGGKQLHNEIVCYIDACGVLASLDGKSNLATGAHFDVRRVDETNRLVVNVHVRHNDRANFASFCRFYMFTQIVGDHEKVRYASESVIPPEVWNRGSDLDCKLPEKTVAVEPEIPVVTKTNSHVMFSMTLDSILTSVLEKHRPALNAYVTFLRAAVPNGSRKWDFRCQWIQNKYLGIDVTDGEGLNVYSARFDLQ